MALQAVILALVLPLLVMAGDLEAGKRHKHFGSHLQAEEAEVAQVI
jgi:hypothetical protein